MGPIQPLQIQLSMGRTDREQRSRPRHLDVRRGGIALGCTKAYEGDGEVQICDLGNWAFNNVLLRAFILSGSLY